MLEFRDEVGIIEGGFDPRGVDPAGYEAACLNYPGCGKVVKVLPRASDILFSAGAAIFIPSVKQARVPWICIPPGIESKRRFVMDWLWEHLAGIAVWEWIIVPLVGLAVGLARKYLSRYTGSLLYGLIAALLTLFLIIGAQEIVVLNSITKQTVRITPDQIEGAVRSWAGSMDLSVREAPHVDSAPYFFSFEVAASDGVRVGVSRPKAYPLLLSFRSEMVLNPTSKSALTNLSKDQLELVSARMVIELARLNLEFGVDLPDSFTVNKMTPISEMTSNSFSEIIQTVVNSQLIGKATLEVALAELKQRH